MWKCLESSWWGGVGWWGGVLVVGNTNNHYHSSLSWVELSCIESWSIRMNFVILGYSRLSKIFTLKKSLAMPFPLVSNYIFYLNLLLWATIPWLPGLLTRNSHYPTLAMAWLWWHVIAPGGWFVWLLHISDQRQMVPAPFCHLPFCHYKWFG